MLLSLDLALTGTLALGFGSGLVLCALLTHALLTPGVTFWPAPEKSGWRHHTALGLFRIVCAAIVLAAALEVILHGAALIDLAIGLPMVAAAYGVTLWGYRSLGLENTYGGAEGLVTGGLYAYTRNPQYVTSVLAGVGLAIAAASWTVLGLTGMLLAVYTLFALNEERFLVREYGQRFRDYMDATPRFIGLRSFEQAREDVEERLAR